MESTSTSPSKTPSRRYERLAPHDDESSDHQEFLESLPTATTPSIAATHPLDSNDSSNNNTSVFRKSPYRDNLNSPSMQGLGRPSSFDFEEDEEQHATVRRYQLDFQVTPAEFSHDSLPKRVWSSFLQLRLAARQRRAARLLSLPSESRCTRQSLRACLLTWCCDATDRGILLAAAVMALWILVGISTRQRTRQSWWWYTGIMLFVIRVSARRLYEYALKRRRRTYSGITSEWVGNYP